VSPVSPEAALTDIKSRLVALHDEVPTRRARSKAGIRRQPALREINPARRKA